MYVLKLKLNRLVLYKSPSSNFVLSVIGYRCSLKNHSYDVFFMNFKSLFKVFEQERAQIKFNSVLKRTLKQRLALTY